MPASSVKTEKLSQTKFDKYALFAKSENIFLRNEIKTLKSSQNKDISNPIANEVVLASQEKSKYLLVYPQLSFGLYGYKFLGPTKFNLTYWNELKYGKKLNHSISFQLFITLLRLRCESNILIIAHWYGV